MDCSEKLTNSPSIVENGLSSPTPPVEPTTVVGHAMLSKGRTILLVSTLTGTVLVGSMNTGLTTVGLPRLTKDLHMPGNLVLWFVLLDGRER